MAGYSMAAANMYGMFPNAYNNQVALNDLCGLDLYSPMAGAMGMNGSIFPPMGGFGVSYPMMPMGGNYQNYYDNYEKYQDFLVKNRVNQQQKMRNADLQLNSPQEGIARKASLLREKIMQDEQQQIIPAYKAFLESVRSMYGDNASAEEIQNRAMSLYQQQYGTTVTEDIRKFGKNSYTQGLFQTLTFGLADNTTAEENISKINGQPVSRWENAKKVAGNATGGAIFGVSGAIALNCIWKNKGPIAKAICRVPVLAAIGGLVAGALAFTNKN